MTIGACSRARSFASFLCLQQTQSLVCHQWAGRHSSIGTSAVRPACLTSIRRLFWCQILVLTLQSGWVHHWCSRWAMELLTAASCLLVLLSWPSFTVALGWLELACAMCGLWLVIPIAMTSTAWWCVDWSATS